MNKKIESFINKNLEKTIKCNPKDDGTLIGLPYKYTIPCVSDMFQEMFYWDTYFTNVGLHLLGKTDLAKNNTDNMLYLVEKYGFMPNGSRTFFLNRSQPPYLSLMVKEVFEKTNDIEWLGKAYSTLKKEYDFWQNNKVLPNGLNGYTNYNTDIIDDKQEFFEGFLFRTGHKIDGEITEEIFEDICQAYSSVCESGWDCNSRVKAEGHYHNSVDLNSLLYALENNMQNFALILKNGEEKLWEDRKLKRKEKMQVLWNGEDGIFADFNLKTNKFATYKTAANFYPLFVKLATEEQAGKTVKLLEKLELEYGISSGERYGEWNCQWDYPNVWAPMQYLVYNALINYGYEDDARRIAKKYVNLLETAFEETGNFWEKYDGNTGKVTTNEYNAPAMMGWTMGVYVYFCNELNL